MSMARQWDVYWIFISCSVVSFFFFFFCIADPASPLRQCWSQHFVDKEHEHLIHVPTVVGIDSTIEPSNKVAIASIREQRKRPLQDEDGLVSLQFFRKKEKQVAMKKKNGSFWKISAVKANWKIERVCTCYDISVYSHILNL